ncbi:MAG: helix-hairpin-helix domain-containing protein [Caldilineaceae bacterium]
MKNLEAIRTVSQENLSRLVDLGKQQPSEVQTWGVTATAAVAGGLVMLAGAQGLLALLGALASPPVSLTVGAIGGGALGWLYMERHQEPGKTAAVKETTNSEPAPPPMVVSTTGSKMAAVETVATEMAGAPVVAQETAVPEIITDDHTVSATVDGQPEPAATAIAVATSSEAPETIGDLEVVVHDSILPERASEPILITPETAPEGQTVEPPTTTATPLASVTPPQQDDLEAINGIGPVFARRLHDAGIYTYVQLAALTPDHLHEIMASSRGGQMIHADEWIAQACQLATTSNG